jgi:hypothetical protein
MRHRLLYPFVIALAVACASCMSKPVDLAKALEVIDVTTGYFDAGIVEGTKNKIVPAISLRLKNRTGEPIESVQMMARFSVVGETEELGSAPFVRAIGLDGLPPGQTGQTIVMKSNLGYTSEAPRASMFTHSLFKDVRIQLFGKHKAQQFQPMGEYTVARQLLTR